MDIRLTFVAAPEQLSARLSGESVVLGVGSGTYFGLDDVAARVWDLLQEPTSGDRIRDVVVAEYDVEAPACERDLLAFLEALQAHGMIEVRDGSPG